VNSAALRLPPLNIFQLRGNQENKPDDAGLKRVAKSDLDGLSLCVVTLGISLIFAGFEA